MKPFPALPVFWFSLLVLWVSQSEIKGSIYNVCEVEKETDAFLVQTSTGLETYVEPDYTEDKFTCLLHHTNLLNCSWSFHMVEDGAQICVSISVCDNNLSVESRNQPSVERVGSMSWTLSEQKIEFVIVQFNTSLGDKWTVYTCVHEVDILRLLPPPENISLTIKDGSLIMTWDAPRYKDKAFKLQCITFQLDMGEQEKLITLEGRESYTVPNPDPSCTYSLRMRAKVAEFCYGAAHWSEWSHTAVLEQNRYRLESLVIVSISLGVPMILLAVLLLVRYQRLSKLLFPPIPRPPPKYKYFLERNDPQSFFHPVPPAKPEEEITEVEDTDHIPAERSEL